MVAVFECVGGCRSGIGHPAHVRRDVTGFAVRALGEDAEDLRAVAERKERHLPGRLSDHQTAAISKCAIRKTTCRILDSKTTEATRIQ